MGKLFVWKAAEEMQSFFLKIVLDISIPGSPFSAMGCLLVFNFTQIPLGALIYFGVSLVKMIDTSVLEGRRESSCFLGVKICNPWWCYFMCWEWNWFVLYRKFINEMSKSIRWKVLCRKRCNTNGFCIIKLKLKILYYIFYYIFLL